MTDLVETFFKVPADPRPWKVAREETLERDGHECQASAYGIATDCVVIGSLHVHHCLPRSRGGRNNDENLVTLCTGHHVHAHSNVAESIESGLLVATSIEGFEELEENAELEPCVLPLRLILGGLGYPDAHVYVEAGAIRCDEDDVPPGIWDDACDLFTEQEAASA